MSPEARQAPRRSARAILYDPRLRAIAYQFIVVVLVGWAAWHVIHNVQANLEAQRIATGFGFLNQTAGFAVNQSLIPYQESDTYGRVFVVGLLNTLLVAVIGIVLSTILGFIIGVARLSSNYVVARLAEGYVEIVRNLPLLFQILFWYLAVLGALPGVRNSVAIGVQPSLAWLADKVALFGGGALTLAEYIRSASAWFGPPDFFVNNRGLIVPEPVFHEGGMIVLAVLAFGIAAAIVMRGWARRRLDATGRAFPVGLASVALVIGLPLLALAAMGFPVGFTRPELRGFNFVGGVRLNPELVALVVALTTYTASFIAEVVRAGILAVSRGQSEAAAALGLKRGVALRLIVIPQALRVIVPPLTNQYLNLTKNSTLGAAIGYPDLFSVFAGSALNITGQAIEIIAITMAVYLFISLVTSMLMTWYNARIMLRER